MYDKRSRFHSLHHDGLFLMPNPWDVGSARLLESMGFPALATTSSGHAATLGRVDYRVTRDELLTHAREIAAAVALPINVDSERCFADDPEGVAETIHLLAETGVAGCSIEDYDPASGQIDSIDTATERVAAAAQAAHRHDMVLTARTENLLHERDDLDEVIARLRSYRDAGADVVYAPGLVDLAGIEQVVGAVVIPVNVLARPNGPTISELASVGVRRVSTGGALARAALGAVARGARELLDRGTSSYTREAIGDDALRIAFD
ncbi:MAG: isocitrate lyase/PEP mutase family protein [Acidimicrobiia bacterium]